MEERPEQRERRILTPAVLASTLFAAACATFAISFVAARGGLQLPVAATPPPVAVASAEPTFIPPPAPLSSPAPSAGVVEPSPIPTVEPTAPATTPPFALPTMKPGDPLLALDQCPEHPSCFIYIVQRSDTFNRILGRYDLKEAVILALNPKLDDPSLIVVGQKLYLGRNRFARLESCPNGERCFLYVVVKGDSVKDIAARYGITDDEIFEANPTMPHPIVPGLVLRLPYPR
jgi:LysM domain